MSRAADGKADDAVVEALLAEALERQADGETVRLEALCAARPDLLPAVAAALGQATSLPDLHLVAAVHRSLAGEDLAGRYRLDAPIGGGSMGVVYAAFDRVLQRRVAVKILRTTLLGGGEAVARFEREAQVLAAVQHPAVVAVYDGGATADGTRFLVMELIDGVPLQRLLDLLAERTAGGASAGRDDMALLADQFTTDAALESGFLRQAVRWTATLAAGLAAVHAAGVLHRDVKPSNVLVRRDGSVVLVDFGIAARHAEATLGDRSTPLGTPAYLDPHLLVHEGKASPRTDVYGLAATLYHMVTLSPPYAGSPHEVLGAVARRDPRPPGSLRPGLPRDLQAVIECGMERDPLHRYASAQALAADLEALLAFRLVAARPISAARRWWRSAVRSRELRAAAATLLLVSGVVGFLAWSQQDDTRRREQWFELWRRLPPELTDAPVGMRAIADPVARAALAERLDRLAALDVDPLPTLLTRAAFRLDHGDARGAAADVQAAVAEVPTSFARAVAEAYAALPDGADETSVPRLPSLPEAPSDEERYLAAFHLRRYEESSLVAFALLDAIIEPPLYVRDLRMRLQMSKVLDLPEPQMRPALQPLQEEAVRVETLWGKRSAHSATVLGIASMLLEQRDEALLALRDGVALAPESHSLRINLANMLRIVGDLAAAREQLEAAIRLRPTTLGARQGLLSVLVDQADFAAAEALVEATPFAAGDTGRAQAHSMRGTIALNQAMAARGRADADGRMRHAEAAVMHFAAGAALGNDGCRQNLPVAQALAGERDDLPQALLQRAALDPLDPAHLTNLLDALPDDLTVEQTASLRRFLLAMRRQLAPHRTERR
jgi:tRNA A-37 threonylcarbamoyl transferase component Bud32